MTLGQEPLFGEFAVQHLCSQTGILGNCTDEIQYQSDYERCRQRFLQRQQALRQTFKEDWNSAFHLTDHEPSSLASNSPPEVQQNLKAMEWEKFQTVK